MSTPNDNPWAAFVRLNEAIQAAGFDVLRRDFRADTGISTLVVDLKTTHPNKAKDEGTQGS